jgi:type I restriction enzyme S subunit
VAGLVDEARRLRGEADERIAAILESALHGHFVAGAVNWRSTQMLELIEIKDRQVTPTDPEFAGLPHISGENMEGNTCRLLPWRTAEADQVKSNNYLFESGTILYSKIRPYLRKAVFVDFRGVCSADVYPIRVKSPNLDPQFLKWSLVAEPFTEYANRLSGRTRMPKLNRKQLFAYALAVPSLDVQLQIVRKLDALCASLVSLRRASQVVSVEIDAVIGAVLQTAIALPAAPADVSRLADRLTR